MDLSLVIPCQLNLIIAKVSIGITIDSSTKTQIYLK